ncbi:hypothetical protein [Allosphingosinicella deserti]|uniref:Uncharacterized protein n=1 Tax=Allosphingosinicella deserti TaxID=2116704 RepID=A0A2P7QIV8_9SPHN|nr:hypothetical protein [Sphingomonas deserti]PSJ37915.1 hypothetical protein C7I55_19580 [Sphingomonas deserti]
MIFHPFATPDGKNEAAARRDAKGGVSLRRGSAALRVDDEGPARKRGARGPSTDLVVAGQPATLRPKGFHEASRLPGIGRQLATVVDRVTDHVGGPQTQ